MMVNTNNHRDKYDLVLAGGGIAGSALAIAMAGRGARVLVLERETRFRDRVRGEGMAPWGVAEVEALGIDAILRSAGGHTVPYWDAYMGPGMQRRDMQATTPFARPAITFYHPAVQEALLSAAANAGAEVRRGVHVAPLRRDLLCPGYRPARHFISAGQRARPGLLCVSQGSRQRSIIRRLRRRTLY